MDLFKKLISRRTFIETTSKSVAITSAASAITLPFNTLAQPQKNESSEVVKHSACLVNCGSRCALKVIVKDDIIQRIEPEDAFDESTFGQHQIRPCLRGRSNKLRVYSPDRLKYPMVRVGKRGEGKFKRISWEEATKLIATKLTETRQKYGNESIYYIYQSGAYYHTQGTSAWKRMLNLTGGYLNYHNTYSTAQIRAAAPYTFGDYIGSHFTEVENSDLVVFFGLNLSETRMSGGGQVEELRRSLSKSKAKTIIIDPRYTDSVVTSDAEWLSIKPTSDAALVAGLVHTMITEGLIDEETINKYAIGFDQTTLPASANSNSSYKDYVLGTSDDKTVKDAKWAASVTGIPAKRITQLAREIATANACYIAQGWGPQRHQNGEASVRAIQTLSVIANQWGRPGTNAGVWPYATRYGVPSLPALSNPIKHSIPCYAFTTAIDKPEVMSDITHGVRGTEKLNTGIKLIINQAGNALINQHGDTGLTKKILEDDTKCEFIVVCDNHMTPSAKFADILLPETSYLEAADLVDNSYASGSNHFMIGMEPVIAPLWEVRSSYDICADIAEHLGVKQEYTEGRSQQQWIEHNYNIVRQKRPYLPPYNKESSVGLIDQRREAPENSVAFSAFWKDPDANPLKTPSGKIEIYSERLAKLEQKWVLPEKDRIPVIPGFYPVEESHLDPEGLKKYPLQMIGFHTKGHTHSTYAQLPILKEAIPDEIWINPINADQRGIRNGDPVLVQNDRGKMQTRARVTPRVMPDVVAMPQGGWLHFNKAGIDIGGNINTLTNLKLSPLAKGNPQHTNLVDIVKA